MQGKGERTGAHGKGDSSSACLSSRTGSLIQLSSSGMKCQGNYAGKDNPDRKGMSSHTLGVNQACPCNLREELKSGFDCGVHLFRNGSRFEFFTIFALNYPFPKVATSRLFQQRPQSSTPAGTRRDDRQQTWSTVTLGILPSFWTFGTLRFLARMGVSVCRHLDQPEIFSSSENFSIFQPSPV